MRLFKNLFNHKLFLSVLTTGFLFAVCFHPQAQAQDSPQWGEKNTRNMVSQARDLPSGFNPETGENIKWSVSIGSHGYATPVISNGKVLIGANNADHRDPRHEGDRGVLLCLNESDGSLCWQLVAPRLQGDRHKDWQTETTVLFRARAGIWLRRTSLHMK